MTFALLGALLFKLLDFVKGVRARDANLIVTQLTVWVGGIALAFLASASTLFADVQLPVLDVVFADVGGWDKVLVGLMLGSLASVANDAKNAVDNTGSAAKPSLIPPPAPKRNFAPVPRSQVASPSVEERIAQLHAGEGVEVTPAA